MPFPDPLARGNGALIKSSLHSPDYAAGVAGWTINKDGTAEFSDVLVRGSLVSGIDPTQIIIGPAADLPPPLDTYLLVGTVYTTADGAMTYMGVREYPLSSTGYIFEQGIVDDTSTIIPVVQTGGSGSYWKFVADTFLSIGGSITDPSTFVESSNTDWQMDNGGNWSWNGTGFESLDIDVDGFSLDFWEWAVWFSDGASLTLDGGATMSSEDMRLVGSGPITGDYSWTATTYGITTTAGVYFSVDCVFKAPASGQVRLDWRGQLLNSVATNQSFISPVIRTGGTVGAGTTVLIGADVRAMICGITSANPGQSFVSAFTLVPGLTPGDTYNVRLEHRVNAGTGRTLLGEILVTPSL